MTVARLWPRCQDCNETAGLWCWGCARRFWRKGTTPTIWVEVLCGDPTCPGEQLAHPKAVKP